ncbi:hypothetical protein AUJ17_00120 [Candidatus Micrarchaeota archaeon CG1_02_47_40]|nr:MAG: hypothetical protein AUJ17_00120 [Candidatus Micrarchaeota archaeon CG1_02_47_40]
MEEKKGNETYKALQGDQPQYLFADINKQEIERELEEVKRTVKDPFLLSSLMLRTVREKESTNLILKNIMEKIEGLEKKIGQAKAVFPPSSPTPNTLLPQTDEEILSFIEEKGAACAADIQKKFNYKGKNAACARLSRLSELGHLVKKQVGKQVFYHLKAHFGGSGR